MQAFTNANFYKYKLSQVSQVRTFKSELFKVSAKWRTQHYKKSLVNTNSFAKNFFCFMLHFKVSSKVIKMTGIKNLWNLGCDA